MTTKAVSEAEEPALCPCGKGYVGHAPGSWLEPCAGCELPTHVDDGAPDRGPAICSAACRAEWRAVYPLRRMRVCVHNLTIPHSTEGMHPRGDGHCSGPGSWWPDYPPRPGLMGRQRAWDEGTRWCEALRWRPGRPADEPMVTCAGMVGPRP